MQVKHNKRFLYIKGLKLESLLYSKTNRKYFKDELNTNNRTGNTNAQHLKKYKEKIAKEIENIKQRELDQVGSSLNSSLITQLNFNVFIETQRRKKQTNWRDQRQNQTAGRHNCRGDQVQGTICREEQDTRSRYWDIYFFWIESQYFRANL